MTDVDVVIVGAGVSGLQAAQDVMKAGLSCIVVEASNYVGGRVCADTTLIPGAVVDLGAELVHGSTNALVDLCASAGIAIQEVFTWSQGDGGPSDTEAPDGGAGYYFDGHASVLYRFNELPPALTHMHEALFDLDTAPGVRVGTSLRSYLTDKGVVGPEMDMACSGMANTAGGTVDTIDAGLSQHQAKLWVADGDVDYRVPGGMVQIVHCLQKGVSTVLNWKVGCVDASDAASGRVVVTRDTGSSGSGSGSGSGGDDDTLTARAVIVTVSPAVLKDRSAISFTPPLSVPRQAALRRVGFPNAVKIHLTFSKRCWPKDCHGAVFSVSPVPEMWFRDVPTADGSVVYLATGFLMGPRADALVAVPSSTSTAVTLSQIYRAFRVPGTHSALLSSRCHDWGAHAHVHGGYTSARVGETVDDRRAVSEPHCGRVFFAGEAVAGAHGESPMTLQGTLVTGRRAASEAIAVVGAPRSRL